MSPVLYRTVSADPPWPERGGGRVTRGAQRHYPLISRREDILRVMVQAPVWNIAENAHLYLWVTNNYLPWGLWLVDALGFTYKTNLPWDKGRGGLGQYFRGEHELCLFAVRGRGKDPSVYTGRKDIGTMIRAPQRRVRKHSAKPEEAVRDKIEARSKGPYLEMFARSLRDGWMSWGDSAVKFPWKNVLILSPHPDDAELGCGSTVTRLIEDGAHVTILTLSDCSEPDIKNEAYRASEILGSSRVFLNHPVRRFSYRRQELLDDLVAQRDAIQPDAVFCPSVHDTHQDHSVVSSETFRAFKYNTIIGYVLPWNHRTLDTNLYVTLLRHHVDKKIEALHCYKSQKQRKYMDPDIVMAALRLNGMRANSVFAEQFELVRAVV